MNYDKDYAVIAVRQDEKHGICPSCQNKTEFTLLGIQRWPKKVALSAGLTMEQAMWQCSHCITSVMEDSIIHDLPQRCDD